MKNQEQKIKDFLANAKSHKDSGFCGGCSYVEFNLRNFLDDYGQEAARQEKERILGIIKEMNYSTTIDIFNVAEVFGFTKALSDLKEFIEK